MLFNRGESFSEEVKLVKILGDHGKQFRGIIVDIKYVKYHSSQIILPRIVRFSQWFSISPFESDLFNKVPHGLPYWLGFSSL